ncbi:hypothetical protein RUND412_005096, partial [Rhizina undulata]
TIRLQLPVHQLYKKGFAEKTPLLRHSENLSCTSESSVRDSLLRAALEAASSGSELCYDPSAAIEERTLTITEACMASLPMGGRHGPAGPRAPNGSRTTKYAVSDILNGGDSDMKILRPKLLKRPTVKRSTTVD